MASRKFAKKKKIKPNNFGLNIFIKCDILLKTFSVTYDTMVKYIKLYSFC